VENNTEIARGSVGVHIWEIAGPFFARRLRRRAMFRTQAGAHTPVLWTRGKGVVGRCWISDEKDQLTDLAELQAYATTEDRFCALEPRERFNLTWSEFQAAKQYNLIWVTKLYRGQGDAPKLKGLLSVDVEGRGHADELAKALTTHKAAVRALLDMCEQLLA
ncbi:MAG TPA: hypothetical protein VG366_03080, partial [Solirubrobacteraceae bacterium]|nr:hypothetical protein [Solirubrobacteraceae bacterium]